MILELFEARMVEKRLGDMMGHNPTAPGLLRPGELQPFRNPSCRAESEISQAGPLASGRDWGSCFLTRGKSPSWGLS